MCTRTYVRTVFAGHVRAPPTDGTACDELLRDNYGACWGKVDDDSGRVCVYV